jgi:prepilin-type N-terminal cleavage/methylation domain-containing protein
MGKPVLKKGFSLIEVLVALFILGLGIAVLFNLFPLGWQALAHSRKLNEAYILAQKKLEELKMQGMLQQGEVSGKDRDFSWLISTKPYELEAGIEVIYVELEIDFDFQKTPQKQIFVTYITPNE